MSFFESVKAERLAGEERQREIVSALRAELQQIHALLDCQQDWFSKLRNHLGTNTYSRISHIPFPRAIYDGQRVAIYSCMPHEQLQLLHLAYSYLSIIDATLDKFDSIVEQSVRTYPEYQRYAGAQMRVDELKLTGLKAKDIIIHHLTGSKLEYVHSPTHLG